MTLILNSGQRNNRRRLIIAFGAATLIAPFVLAQEQRKIWRLGYLDLGSSQSMADSGRYAALMEGLRERGYVEGRNLVLEVCTTRTAGPIVCTSSQRNWCVSK